MAKLGVASAVTGKEKRDRLEKGRFLLAERGDESPMVDWGRT